MSEQPEKLKRREIILARLNDPMVIGGKIGYVETPGDIEGVCDGTGVKITYKKDPLYPITAVAVNRDAAIQAGWFDKQRPLPQPEPKEPKIGPIVDQPKPKPIDKPKTCPKCGGKRRGRGYSHMESCTR